MRQLKVGDRVQVYQKHWLRGNHRGTIIEEEDRGESRWLVQFDVKISGKGIDGDKLWLDALALKLISRG